MRGGFRIGLSTAAVLAVAALVPAAASALDIRTQQVNPGVIFLEAGHDFANDVGVTWVISPNGKPDLVIGDLSAGIADPIPSQCARVDPSTVRCPADLFTALDAVLGPGPDSIGVVPAVGVDGFINMRLQLGAGKDRARDAGQTRDVWNGGPGRDVLDSGPGNDKVKGGAQNDIIDCGFGHDLGIGGPGKLDLSRNCETVRH